MNTTLPMRAISALALLLGGVWTAASGTPTTESAPGTPHAVVDTPTLELEPTVRYVEPAFRFQIRNQGDAPLEITSVTPQSVSAIIDRFDAVIEPGETGEIAGHLRAATQVGVLESAIAVETNDPAKPTLELTVSTKVKAIVAAAPGFARWIYVQGEAEGTITQRLWAVDGSDFRVVGAVAPGDDFTVEVRRLEGEERDPKHAGPQWAIDMTLHEDAAVGALGGVLAVSVEHPLEQQVQIPVSGFVRPTWFVSPAERDLGHVELSEPVTHTFRLRNFSTTPMTIESVETGMDGLEAAVEETEAGHRFDIDLTFQPGQIPTGPFSTVVRVVTGQERFGTIEFDVSGTIVVVGGES